MCVITIKVDIPLFNRVVKSFTAKDITDKMDKFLC